MTEFNGMVHNNILEKIGNIFDFLAIFTAVTSFILGVIASGG